MLARYALMGLLLAGGFCLERDPAVREGSVQGDGPRIAAFRPAATKEIREDEQHADAPYQTMAKADPLALLRIALDRYERSVHDYICTFTKQELVAGRLTAEQVMRVKFRERPFSVDMVWLRNADQARRAVYIEGKWTDGNGGRLAYVEPNGALARLFVDGTFLPIDGARSRRAARKRIDQFGFGNSLRSILKYAEMAAQRNELDLRYAGEADVGGRPTYVLERRSPYTGDGGRYPDALLQVNLDKEYLVPTSCVSYADNAAKQLLGRYVLTDVQFNVGLADRDFAEDAGTR